MICCPPIALAALHLNDSKKPLGSRVDRHEHIGRGEIGLNGFRYLFADESLGGLPGYLETEKGVDEESGEDWDAINLRVLRESVCHVGVGRPRLAELASLRCDLGNRPLPSPSLRARRHWYPQVFAPELLALECLLHRPGMRWQRYRATIFHPFGMAVGVTNHLALHRSFHHPRVGERGQRCVDKWQPRPLWCAFVQRGCRVRVPECRLSTNNDSRTLGNAVVVDFKLPLPNCWCRL